MRIIFVGKIVLVSLTALLMSASLALALANNVSNSKHNFNPDNPLAQVRSTQYVGEFNEVCKYCHTPHNAGSNNLLWNKANRTGATYRMYTSSRTLTRATVTGTFTSDSPSLLCLGCHDGKTALNVMHNTTGGVDASADGYASGAQYVKAGGSSTAKTIENVNVYDLFDPLNLSPIATIGMNLGAEGANATQGDNLQNDHPVGFSYQAVISERSAGLYTIPEVSTKSSNKIKFFGTTKRLECSSCHNPHADYDDVTTRPFLVMSNSGSALCLSCHNK